MDTRDLFSLQGRNALVTGGARGLGFAMAKAMAQFGANIALMDLNFDQAKEAADELTQFGTTCVAVEGDVSDELSANAALDEVVSLLGTTDILLNNAGIPKHSNTQDLSLEDWHKVLAVNLDGVFIMSKAVFPHMQAKGKGSIINISSMSGLIVNTPQNQATYNTSKAAVIHLTKSLAVEWAPFGIRVNTIAPGYMLTPMTQAKFDANLPMVQRWMQFSPMNRPGRPEELGGAIVYLASDAASFTTGAVLVVDGGYTCW